MVKNLITFFVAFTLCFISLSIVNSQVQSPEKKYEESSKLDQFFILHNVNISTCLRKYPDGSENVERMYNYYLYQYQGLPFNWTLYLTLSQEEGLYISLACHIIFLREISFTRTHRPYHSL